MGTDIFLYEQNADVNKDKPQGYLWASVWQEKENALLRMIFPEDFWVERIDKRGFGIPRRYKFTQEGFEVLTKILKNFESSIIQKTEFKRFKFPGIEQIFKDSEDATPPGIENEAGMDFANSVIKFYRKGMELESKGSNPEVQIHW